MRRTASLRPRLTSSFARAQKVNLAPAVSAYNEQAFLREHYDVLQADTAADPRLAFRQPGSSSSSSTGTNGFGGGLGPSVVGPMAGTSLDLPTVFSTMERARERAEAGAGAAAAGASREERYRAGAMSRQVRVGSRSSNCQTRTLD